jgi:hypothetical protein
MFIQSITAKLMAHWFIHNHSPEILDKPQASKIQSKQIPGITYTALQNETGYPQAWASDIIFRDS